MPQSPLKSSDPTVVSDNRYLLKEKAIIVTGGSRGIGRAIVKELIRQGAKVVFTYSKENAAAEELVAQIKNSGGNVYALRADVRDFKRATEVISETTDRFGRLDGLVNNAGVTHDKAFMLIEPEDWQEVLDVNLTGVFNYCRASIITFMKQRSGRIVNISSIAGLVSAPRQVNYSASKAGVIGLTRSLAKEVVAYNITVNAVAPGYIETDMVATIPEKRRGELQREIPAGRFGRPEEIANIVAVLLSDLASYITGQTIPIDGGLSI